MRRAVLLRRPTRDGRAALFAAIVLVLVGLSLAFAALRCANEERRPSPVRPAVPVDTHTEPRSGAKAGDAPAAGEPAVERAPAPDAAMQTLPLTAAAVEGWRVAGRILARDTKPLGGAIVRIAFSVADDERILGETTSAADGSYVLAAPALCELDPLAASVCRVIATVEADHHAPRRASIALDQHAADGAVRIDVILDAGERLTGRVVDSRGQAVPQANVRLSVARSRNGITSFPLVQEQVADARGRFALGFTSSGQYHLAARADGVGTAFDDELVLEAGSGRAIGDMVLAGGEPIAGTVTHADGSPAAHFELWAIEAGFALDPDGLALAVRKSAENERADGLHHTRTRTDEVGRFALRGLRPGHYALRSPDAHAVLEPHQARFEPGQADVELKLLSCSLVVRVRDEHGAPVRGASVRLTTLTTLPDGRHERDTATVATAGGAQAAATFCIDPETPYALEAWTSSRTSREEFVMLAQNELVREMEVLLPRRPPLGRIRLDVQGEDGLPLAELQVAVITGVTGARREDIGVLEPDENGLLPPLPCDDYHLLVGYAPGTERYHLPMQTDVSLIPGEPVRVRLHPRRGGRIAVSVVLAGDPPEGFTDAGSGSGATRRAPADDARRARFGSTVLLAPEGGGGKRTLVFQQPGDARFESRLLPGETMTAWELLEPGAYSVSLESPTGWSSRPQTVRLVPGQTASAQLDVRAR